MTSFTGTDSTSENEPVTISYAMLAAHSNESDVDTSDTVSFRITSVDSGTLTIGGSAYASGTNDTITSDSSLVWTPASGVNGTGVSAFHVEAWDGDLASASPVGVTIDVVAQASEFSLDLRTDTLVIPSFDVDDMVVISGVSAADVTYAIAGPNTEISYTDVGSDNNLDKLTITNFTAALDGTQVLFDNGSVLKVGTSVLVGTSAPNGDQLIAADGSGVTMRGGAGADVLRGNAGADIFFGGSGNDKLYTTTDSAQDVFLYTAKAGSLNDGNDLIYGFENGTDKIKITDVTTAQLSGSLSTYVTVSSVDTGVNTLLTFADGNTVKLMGINSAGIDANDFIGYA